MSATVELTLKELAQIALGAPQLTKVHVTILHSLIDLLLKKLDCANEKVSLGSFESRCLVQILKESKIAPLAFNDEKITIIPEKLNCIDELVAQVASIDSKLEHHFEQVRVCNKADIDKTFALPLWEPYTNTCEDMCTLCENEIACKLLGDCDFLKKLMRRISQPIVERIFEFERKIVELNDELHQFMERAEEQYEKLKLIQGCIIELEALKERFHEQELKFLGTMEEVQDMLDAKLDKLHMPPLKKYIQDYFNHIETRLKLLETQKSCGKAAGVIMNLRCLSCGSDGVCSEMGVLPMAELPDARLSPKKKITKLKERFCSCESFGLRASQPGVRLTERLQSLNPQVVENMLMAKRRRSNHGRLTIFEEIVGTDGNVYKKA